MCQILTGLARVCDKRLTSAAKDSTAKSVILHSKAPENKGEICWTAVSRWPEGTADTLVIYYMDVVDWMALACQCGLHRFGAYCLQRMLCNHQEVCPSSQKLTSIVQIHCILL